MRVANPTNLVDAINSRSKPWYSSRLIHAGAIAVLGAVADGLLNDWGWRQIAVAALGALVVILRTDTKKEVRR